jgi:hypothetical protein
MFKMSRSNEASMFRRGFYLSELIPLLAAAAMLGTALYGLLTGRIPWLSGSELLTLVNQAHDPGLYWLSVTLYLVGGVVLGILSLRTLRGH